MNTQSHSLSTEFLVPLSSLVRDPDNVRKTIGKKQSIDDLVASLREHGQIQNLVVRPVDAKSKKQSRFAVVAGDRRLRAFQRRCEAGEIPKNHPIRVVSVAAEQALAISLAENTQRQSLHPADEFEAFKNLLDSGKSVEEVAAAFGVSPIVVTRRLRLANVSTTLLTHYKNDALTLDHLMAYAITTDHARQEALFSTLSERRKTHAHVDPDDIRHALRDGALRADAPLVKFVGLKQYVKAGGAIERDLFDDEDKGMICDAALLESLAQSKLDKHLGELLTQGFAWVETRLSLTYEERNQFAHVPQIERQASKKERIKLDSLTKRIDALAEQIAGLGKGDEADQLFDQYETERESLDSERQTLKDALLMDDPKAAPFSGAIVYVDHSGVIDILRGVVKPEDKPKLRAILKSTSPANSSENAKSTSTDSEPGQYSATLSRNVTAHYTAALQLAVQNRPHIALALCVDQLLAKHVSFLGDARSEDLRIAVTGTQLKSGATDIDDNTAFRERTSNAEQLISKVPHERRLAWLIAQSSDELMTLLAALITPAINAVTSDAALTDNTMVLANATGLDFAAVWSASADSYLRHVSKSQIVEAVLECDPDAGEKVRKTKTKGGLIVIAEQALAGKRWIPPFLRVSS